MNSYYYESYIILDAQPRLSCSAFTYSTLCIMCAGAPPAPGAVEAMQAAARRVYDAWTASNQQDTTAAAAAAGGGGGAGSSGGGAGSGSGGTVGGGNAAGGGRSR
jgi:hypothetical protein